MAGFQTECFGKQGAAGRHFVLSKARLASALLRGSELAGSGSGLPAPLTGPPAALLQHLDAHTAAQQSCRVPFSFRYRPQHLIHYHWLPVKTGNKLFLRIPCYPFSLLIYQRGGLCSLLTNVPVELLVIFLVPHWVKLHLRLDFPDPDLCMSRECPCILLRQHILDPLPLHVPLFPQSWPSRAYRTPFRLHFCTHGAMEILLNCIELQRGETLSSGERTRRFQLTQGTRPALIESLITDGVNNHEIKN